MVQDNDRTTSRHAALTLTLSRKGEGTKKEQTMKAGSRCTAVLLAAAAVLCCRALSAAEQASSPPDAAAARGHDAGAADKDNEVSPNDKLAGEERHIAERYKRLEEVLLRMAELSAMTDPRRAALLKKAVAQSKEQLINVRFEQLVELLGKDQLSRALDNQTELSQDLRALLELLLSENRARQAEMEKALIREYLKQVNEIIRQEKELQGRTTGGDEMKRLAEQQGRVADKTGGLARDIQRNEEAKNGGGRGSSGKNERGEKANPPDRSGREPSPQDGGKKSEGDKRAGGNQQPATGKPAEGRRRRAAEDGRKPPKGRSAQPGEGGGEPGEKSQDDYDSPQNPARRRLEAAQQRMREAENKLKEAQRRGAADKEEEALRELQQAKADLEEILRQLREEQIARMLAMLEARFRKMLQMEEEVYEGTVRLDKVPAQERSRSHEIEASRLSGKQLQIVVELDKAALLLREDGSAVAFPEALSQVRDDMQQVVERLAQAKVGNDSGGRRRHHRGAEGNDPVVEKGPARHGQQREAAAGPVRRRPARATADRRPGRIADDPRLANAGQYADRPIC